MKKRAGKERRGQERLQNGGTKGRSEGGTFFCSSDVFKADPLGFFFLWFSHSPSPLSSLLRSFSHHLSEVSTAAGHSVVDFEFPSSLAHCVFVCERIRVCVC